MADNMMTHDNHRPDAALIARVRADQVKAFRALSKYRLKYPPRYQVSWGWCGEAGSVVSSFGEALELYRAHASDRYGAGLCNLDAVDIIDHDGESGTDILSDGLTEIQREMRDAC
jgi:hypothetical protein